MRPTETIGSGAFLAGKTALVTSASRNLGEVIVERLAAHGATVAANYYRSENVARELVARLSAHGGAGHVAVQGDTSTGDGVRQLVEGALEQLGGRIDVLVNNSGPWAGEPFVALPEPEWDRIVDGTVKAAYVSSQLVAPGMRQAGWGRIVNIAAGSIYVRNHSVYGLAKDALVFLTEELAVELGPEITVNAVSPGQIAESSHDVEQVDATFVRRAVEQTPARRLVTRSEVAAVVALLCSPAFDMLTGATIPLDGGWRFYCF